MVNRKTSKNSQELYKFYNKDNSFYPLTSKIGAENPPPKVYLNPSILLLSKKLDFSLYETLESIQQGEVVSAWPTNEQFRQFNVYFNMGGAAGPCPATTKVFRKISKGLKNINEPINQFLNQDSLYDFRNIGVIRGLLDSGELPIEHEYYLYQRRGGWSYSPGIFILNYGEKQPSFLNWRESPF
jgi:hypothetical protein